jgi:hypothetical protein
MYPAATGVEGLTLPKPCMPADLLDAISAQGSAGTPRPLGTTSTNTVAYGMTSYEPEQERVAGAYLQVFEISRIETGTRML